MMHSDLFRLERRSMALICGLVLLVGLIHQSLMVSPWHRTVMAATAAPASESMARDDASPLGPPPAERRDAPPPSSDCPAGQIVPPQSVSLSCLAPLAGTIVDALPAASAASQPRAFSPYLPPGRRRALLQVYLI